MKSLVFLNLIIFSLIVFNSVKDCAAGGGNVKKSVDERDDNGDTNDESKDESLDIPIEPNEQQPAPNELNVTCTRRSNFQMHETRNATPKQFPFVASIMSQQNEHLCTGTVVANGLILTSAQCTQEAISFVLLNATKAKKDETTVVLHIIKTERFPTYAEGNKGIGLIYTDKYNVSIAAKIKLSNFTSTRDMVDMVVFGFGLNSEVGQTKDLQFIGVENRLTPAHLTDVPDELTAYLDCIDTKVPTCFKDFGGPSISNNELVGVISSGDSKCFLEMTSTFAVNKKIADILPTYIFKSWLEEKIKKMEEKDAVSLMTYPSKPVPSRRKMATNVEPLDSSTNSCHQVTEILPYVIVIMLLRYFNS